MNLPMESAAAATSAQKLVSHPDASKIGLDLSLTSRYNHPWHGLCLSAVSGKQQRSTQALDAQLPFALASFILTEEEIL